jgi:hypothetical protein
MVVVHFLFPTAVDLPPHFGLHSFSSRVDIFVSSFCVDPAVVYSKQHKDLLISEPPER